MNSDVAIQGLVVRSDDRSFDELLRVVVDYRGDATLTLKTGVKRVGYVFNSSKISLDLFPRDSSQKETVLLKDIEQIELSGEDTAKGKSWEDWQRKKRETQPSL
jgi:hypothetical protein